MTAAIHNLREFLALLRREGELVEVAAPVDVDQELAEVHRRAIQLLDRWAPVAGRLRPNAANPLSGPPRQDATRLNQQLEEVLSRLGRLYGDVESWTGPMTADQRTQLEFLERKLAELGPAVDRLIR